MNMDNPIKQHWLAPLEKRFLKSGFAGLSDKQAIELVIAATCHGRKYRKLARNCYEHFDNLSEFLTASPQQLEQLGVPEYCFLNFKLLQELPGRVLKQKIIEKPFNKCSEDVFNYLYYSMRDLKKEVFKVIYLNSRSQIIDVVNLFEGTADNIFIHPREIVESLINRGSTAMIFVHNHPSGDPAPSQTDKQLTRDLVFIGFILQIKVLDHIIIGQDRYFSFADEGWIKKYQDSFLTLKIKNMILSGASRQHHHYLHKEILNNVIKTLSVIS